MNGDFLALLPKSPFGQLISGGSSPMPIQATTVFAFQCLEGVVMAGDHRATAGHIVFSDKTEKILELDAHSLMAIAGVPAVAFEMARTLQTSFEFYRRSQLQPMTLPAKIRALSRLLRDNIPATIQGIGAVAPIFAGVDTLEDAQPGIYFYDPLGAQFEATDYAASGSGAHSIRSVLYYLNKWGQPKPGQMSTPDAIALANRLLITAAEYDTATGGIHPDQKLFATIKILTRQGIKTVALQEHEQAWAHEKV